MQYNILKKNNLIIAAAGSGKTTLLVDTALSIESANILILTYTNANESEIKKKILEMNTIIPANIKTQTWFTFLLQHGIKPYQGSFNQSLFEKKINGMQFVDGKSGVKFTTKDGKKFYWGIEDFEKYFFSSIYQIYSDKLSKFVILANESSEGRIIQRLENIYSHIFIDEIQDLAGYDLEFLKLLFKSKIAVLLVGDPRQVTYLTHHAAKHPKYQDGRIKEFVLTECKKYNVNIDELTLSVSHRNNEQICNFSSLLYQNLEASKACDCKKCRRLDVSHTGIWIVKVEHLESYKKQYPQLIILKSKNSIAPEWNYGKSKGLGFDRVLIYPTEPIRKYLKDGLLKKNVKGKVVDAFEIAKFYVAITRARYSVGIVFNYEEMDTFINGIQKWAPE
jgi:DNA helicase II / ATP-dependent DNA helicase PcrA